MSDCYLARFLGEHRTHAARGHCFSVEVFNFAPEMAVSSSGFQRRTLGGRSTAFAGNAHVAQGFSRCSSAVGMRAQRRLSLVPASGSEREMDG
jgi:hypothetical protein